MYKHRNHTRELQVARKISDLLSDFRVDVDIVGVYLADMIGAVTLNRAIALVEAAETYKRNAGTRIIEY